jgi:hypothetical protein
MKLKWVSAIRLGTLASKIVSLVGSALSRYQWAISRSIVLAVLINVVLLCLVSPANLFHRYVNITTFPIDAAYVAQSITRDFSNSGPDILFLGGSSMRDAVPPRPIVESDLTQMCRTKITAFPAATSSQSAVDGWAILDALKGYAPRLVVVGLTYGRLSTSRNRDPYSLQGQVVELPRSSTAEMISLTHADLSDNAFDFFSQLRRLNWSISALKSELLTPPPQTTPAISMYDRTVVPNIVLSSAEKTFFVQKLYATESANYRSGAPEMTANWTNFAEIVRKRGSEIIFIWTPLSDEMEPITRAYASLTEQVISQLSKTSPVLDLRNALPSSPGSFRDPLHLSIKGREETWPRIMKFLVGRGACSPADGSLSAETISP